MPAEFTKEDIKRVIETFVAKHKRVPLTKELSAILEGMDVKKIQPHLMQYVKSLTKLTVLPNGLVVDDEGKKVWYRNTAGSLVLARYKEDASLGNHITG